MSHRVVWRSWEGAAVGGLASCFAVAAIALGLSIPMGDEGSIIVPALEHTAGVFQPDVKYPSFVFWFYGVFLRLFGASEYSPWALWIARGVNAALSALSVPLLYVTARRYVAPAAAVGALLVYLSAPITALHCFVVKAESLVVVETLLVFWATQRMLDEPQRLRWHVFAALGVSAAITTKLHVLPAFIYAAGWLQAYRTEGARPALGEAAAFVATLLVATLLVWTNLWIFDQVVAHWQSDPYFQPNATTFRAVPGFRSFPYDRYGSFFVSVLPLSLGIPLALLFFAGLLTWRHLRQGADERGLAPRAALNPILGSATLLALTLALNGTLLRIPHSFTTVFLWSYYVVAVVLDHALLRGRRTLAAVLVAIPALYGGWIVSQLDDTWAEGELGPHLAHEGALLLANATSAEPDRLPIETTIERDPPPVLVVLNAYFFNMCKYRDHEIYAANCAYFSRLIAGDAGYDLTTVVPFNIPGRLLSIDPEIREARFYVLHRRETPSTH
ncbi:MAG: glycosyltransferase family 39 protein [Myxococcales bacterium]|nr:glycosyltransferase family 39 protein [Myxococcales bacterium]